MEQHHHRGEWGSNLGFLMAAVGSAVGLGNIWAFPYKMGNNGGFAFLVVYLILAATVGFSIMLCELAIGRRAGRSVLVSYQQAGGRMGTFLGFLAMLSPFLILSFYTVLGAYCIEYMSLNMADLAFSVAAAAGMSGGDSFAAVRSNQFGAVAFTFIFIFICFLIIRGGIKDGIEKFNKVGMPALFIMLVIVIARAVTLPGAGEGLSFMFAPDLTPLTSLKGFLGVLSAAGGQMFFSLSLAMGITVTYGSYLSKKESLVKNSLIIIISDTIVAIMAGMAVLPAAFALGGAGAEKKGPKLLFITLQDVFNAMGPTGPIFGVLFYLLVILAAITSAIALLEVLATFLSDRAALKGHTPDRKKLVTIVCLVVFAEAALVAAGRAVAALERRRVGEDQASPAVDRLAFGAYNKQFAPNRTGFDWLSLNPENVDRYIADPLCGGSASIGLFREMLGGLRFIAKPGNLKKMNANTPVLFLSGAMDPVGECGKGVQRAYRSFLKAGARDVSIQLYPELRHEILNEACREDVCHDLYLWLTEKAGLPREEPVQV